MKEKTIFAQNIQTLRKEKGWTQKQLAQRLGCSFDSIQAYECCKWEPACKVMVALEQVFGVTGAQLYGLEPLPHPEATEPQIQLHETPLPPPAGPGQLSHRHGRRQRGRRPARHLHRLLGVRPGHFLRHPCPRSRGHGGDPAELPALQRDGRARR